MSWSRWHQWSTEAGGLAVYYFCCCTILLAIWRRRHHFIGSFGEEAPFYWLLQRGGTILLGKFWRMLVELFYIWPKLWWRLTWVSFCGQCSTWRAGHLDQVILLVWPYWDIIIAIQNDPSSFIVWWWCMIIPVTRMRILEYKLYAHFFTAESVCLAVTE